MIKVKLENVFGGYVIGISLLLFDSELKWILDFVKALSLPKLPLNMIAEILDKSKVKQVRCIKLHIIMITHTV